MGVNRSKSVTAHGQPADYIITDRGTTFWAEVKSTQELISFPLANISKAQWNGARQVVAAQGAYFFFIKKLATNTWYRVPASFFVEIHAEPIKSVKWSNLEDFKYVI